MIDVWMKMIDRFTHYCMVGCIEPLVDVEPLGENFLVFLLTNKTWKMFLYFECEAECRPRPTRS
jgi:hypothetical protein